VLDDLLQGCGELAGLLGADEARQGLLDDLVPTEAEQLGDGVVRLQDLALQVGDEHRVGGIRDDDVRVERAADGGAVCGTGLCLLRRRSQNLPGHAGPPESEN
jgi:hypothetical protein